MMPDSFAAIAEPLSRFHRSYRMTQEMHEVSRYRASLFARDEPRFTSDVIPNGVEASTVFGTLRFSKGDELS